MFFSSPRVLVHLLLSCSLCSSPSFLFFFSPLPVSLFFSFPPFLLVLLLLSCSTYFLFFPPVLLVPLFPSFLLFSLFLSFLPSSCFLLSKSSSSRISATGLLIIYVREEVSRQRRKDKTNKKRKKNAEKKFEYKDLPFSSPPNK